MLWCHFVAQHPDAIPSVPLQVLHCEVDPNVMRLEKRIDLIAGLEAQQAAEIGFIKAT